MEVNFLLPISLFTIIMLSVLVYGRAMGRIKEFFGSKEISIREVIVIVIFMGILVTVMGLIPGYAVQILFGAAISYTLLIFTYLFTKKIIVAVIPPIIFIAALLLLNLLLIEDVLAVILITDIFSAIFAIIAVTLLSPLFSWRVTIIFAGLLTVMDVFHVFVTGHMVEAAGKIMKLGLPLMILLPRLPSLKELTALGLGDVFLSGLIATRMVSKYNPKAGLITALSISIIFLLFDIIAHNFIQYFRAFPATILVLSGWLLGASPYTLKNWLRK
ncbi:MAG: hypothetical protein QXJ19_01285 [Candidatus Bathyarchaeia archaeon]|nr:hypothetical protein [Candidatus Bathyarchaeota archaeon]